MHNILHGGGYGYGCNTLMIFHINLIIKSLGVLITFVTINKPLVTTKLTEKQI